MNAEAIMGTEIISANFAEKPKRGRPPIIDPRMRNVTRNLWGSGCLSRTGLQNAHYIGEALKALLDHPGGHEAAQAAYRYLGDFDSNDVKLKRTILAELGRCAVPDLIRALAESICRQRLGTQEAVRRLRFIRQHIRAEAAKTA
jgi:hypothetical protein